MRRKNLKDQKKKIMKNAQEQYRIGLTGYPEINFEPVPITDKEELLKRSKYD